MKYPIDFQYTDRNGKSCEIIDYHITRNFENEIVKERYVIKRKILNQSIIDYDVVQTSIDMAVMKRK